MLSKLLVGDFFILKKKDEKDLREWNGALEVFHFATLKKHSFCCREVLNVKLVNLRSWLKIGGEFQVTQNLNLLDKKFV